ncbi:MurR/RpiR family transcriptional regulator [Streptococcus merionis]|uniref:Transcriptional regulator protein n=1 Tax=Streptococcus merionis TaxID=400065 RepID=A0A239SQD9_9STRE|nr:MurR/RpiR family transcriptional regulator [Streptococcus merionis]SNU87665.1 transcriptional regulator protein [Streptococcus merionis]
MTIFSSKINGLTKSEQRILQFIEENPIGVETMTIQYLANQCHTSTATVSRLAKKLGFSHFNKFKLELFNTRYNELYDAQFTSGDSVEQLVMKLANSNMTSIQETLSLINIEELKYVVELIRKATTIYLFGVGTSGTVCSDFYYKLNRLGKNCIYTQDSHIQTASIVSASKDDIAIGISYSGTTKEVLVPLQFAASHSLKTIAITGVGTSPIVTICDFIFRIPRHEQELRVGAIDSRNNSMFLTDLLYLAMIQDDVSQLKSIFETTKELTNLLK